MTSSAALRAVAALHNLHNAVKNPTKVAFTRKNIRPLLTFCSVAGGVTGYSLMETIHRTAEQEHLDKYIAENRERAIDPAVYFQRRLTISAKAGTAMGNNNYPRRILSVTSQGATQHSEADVRQASLWTHAE